MAIRGNLQRSQDIFSQAIEVPESERLKFLENACGTNSDLLKEVQELVSVHFGAAENFLESPPVLESPRAYPGQEIGRYQLLSLIGKGGMADVYLARRTDGVFKNNVALKLVKGSIHSKELIDRLHNERLILSNLKHPNIANLLDGGTAEDGTPYYVMDYIEGLDLLDYIEQHKMSVSEKLKLFIKICAGVSAAHRNLVIHRDLKPSNILVTNNGEPRLLDFGIAKDMTLDTLTAYSLPMTTRYASPEQVRGEMLGTASDIYSLGVILYEVLAGCSPYSSDTPAELIHQITETVPPLMSLKLSNQDRSVSRVLSGDLDTIVMKALHKEPDRRYVSVQQFADDIHRYLTNKPVIARSDSFWYRSHRFVRRNWTIVSIVSVAMVATWVQQVRIIGERDIAELERDAAAEERDKLRQTKEFLVGLFKVSDPGEARGNTITARELLDRGLKQINEGLVRQPEFKSELMITMGVVFRELGLYDESQVLLEEATVLRRKSTNHQITDLARGLNELGSLLLLRGDHEQAMALHQEALEIFLREQNQDHLDVADTHYYIGSAQWIQGELNEAGNSFQNSLSIYLRTLGEEHRRVARSQDFLGKVYWRKGDFAKSIESHLNALKVYEKVLGTSHPEVSNVYTNLGIAHYSIGELDLGLEFLEKSHAIRVETLGAEHPRTAASLSNLGIAYVNKGAFDRGIEFHNKALEIRSKTLGIDHPDLGLNYGGLGIAHFKKGEYERAIEFTEKAQELFIKAYGDDYIYLPDSYEHLANIYLAQGNYVNARINYNKAYDIALVKLGSDHPDTIKFAAQLKKIDSLMVDLD